MLHTSKPQRAAIEWARKEGHKPLVARVRHLNNKKNPDHCVRRETQAQSNSGDPVAGPPPRAAGPANCCASAVGKPRFNAGAFSCAIAHSPALRADLAD